MVDWQIKERKGRLRRKVPTSLIKVGKLDFRVCCAVNAG